MPALGGMGCRPLDIVIEDIMQALPVSEPLECLAPAACSGKLELLRNACTFTCVFHEHVLGCPLTVPAFCLHRQCLALGFLLRLPQ